MLRTKRERSFLMGMLGGGAGAYTMEQLISMLPGLTTYYKMNELSGTAIINAQGETARNGTYAGSIPLNAIAFPTGGAAPNYQDASDDTQIYNAAVAAAWSYQQGWMMLWFKQDAAGEGKNLISADAGRTYMQAHNAATGATGGILCSNPTGAGTQAQRHNDWTFLAGSWKANEPWNAYWQGAKLQSTGTYTNPSGTTLTTGLVLGRLNGFRGAIAHVAIGAGAIPTDAQIDAIYKAAYPLTHRSIFVCGDSWATDNDYWIDVTVAALRTADSNAWREQPLRRGYSGQKIAYIHTQLDALLPGLYATDPNAILMVGCANDITGDTAETPFKADLAGAIDALRAKWAGVPIYIHHPYRDDAYNGSFDVKSLAIKQWQLDVIGTYASGVYAGPDGNVWFKTNIDTWSSDRIHPTTEAGFAEFAAQWLTTLGYE